MPALIIYAIITSDNGSSPDRRQLIIWTNTFPLPNGPLEKDFKEIKIKIQTIMIQGKYLLRKWGYAIAAAMRKKK